MTTRSLKYFQALQEAMDQKLAHDPSVYLMGLGVPDPKGVFGTTLGLQKKYGEGRVMDMPTAENGMTGVALGTALAGMRPVMVHQRLDFALLAIDPIVNQAANWNYMFGGKTSIPLVIRFVVGRGWGQGPQHSQSLQSWFAHVPGLKVVLPATPHDAKGLLISAIEDNNPVIFIEHRWLHNTFGPVPEEMYRIPIGQARVAKSGKDVTIAAISYSVIEALRAAELLSASGVDAEVIDLRSLKPWDKETVLNSVRKTGRLIVADTAWKTAGFAAEIVATASEEAHASLKCAPRRICLPDSPTPTSPALSKYYYPGVADMIVAALEMLNMPKEKVRIPSELTEPVHADVPDSHFTGPF